jgi:hypothetical protein
MVFFSVILAASPFALFQIPQAHATATQNHQITHLLVTGGHVVHISQFRLSPPDVGCNFNHYHAAAGGAVTSVEGVVIPDPNPSGCGYVIEGQEESFIKHVITSADQGMAFGRNIYLNAGLQSDFNIGTFDIHVDALKESTGID